MVSLISSSSVARPIIQPRGNTLFKGAIREICAIESRYVIGEVFLAPLDDIDVQDIEALFYFGKDFVSHLHCFRPYYE